MKAVLKPSVLRGRLAAIPSKSDAHRLLVCAALADRPSELRLPSGSADIEATVRCLRTLGAAFERSGDALFVTPMGRPVPNALLPCGESGSTLRFLLPVAAALGAPACFTGEGRLPERPLGELLICLRARGAVFDREKLPLTVSGALSGGEYTLPGDISSQYVTGLLLALPLLAQDSRIRL
jgi:3-phosphoshikimate 1-carboxyvinyltransferase